MPLTTDEDRNLRQFCLNTARNTATNQADVMTEAQSIYDWITEDGSDADRELRKQALNTARNTAATDIMGEAKKIYGWIVAGPKTPATAAAPGG